MVLAGSVNGFEVKTSPVPIGTLSRADGSVKAINKKEKKQTSEATSILRR